MLHSKGEWGRSHVAMCARGRGNVQASHGNVRSRGAIYGRDTMQASRGKRRAALAFVRAGPPRSSLDLASCCVERAARNIEIKAMCL